MSRSSTYIGPAGSRPLIAAVAFAVVATVTAQPRTLHDSGDPTLALTPTLQVSAPAPSGSAPPNPDPHNLEGVWWLDGYEYLLGPEPGVPPPLKSEYMRILERRIRAKNSGRPEADSNTDCLPSGMPRVTENTYPVEIVQTPGRITMLYEGAHNLRRIWLDRPHPEDPGSTFMGHSVGHWEGDTLVVDTVGRNDRTQLDAEGSSHSAGIHIVERYRKIEQGAKLELVTWIDDPVTLEHPFTYRRTYFWRPDIRPMEYVCEENNRNVPVDGITTTGAIE